MNYSDIKGLLETNDAKEANQLLQDGWSLFDIEKSANGRYKFLLVKQ
ncbi:hypothetical protein [Brevibacillus choshinensis]|uniref:Uncharacterized protein n=1 Tax=Brevibacillus choshinensis TaxID=54911 RepID=A0ABX7FSE8_BRECH|nr:hypothetical protein [Brevibacillus choshinensis]QRG68562.1 hypothetical protein JNE38_05250 [Brevibacillus choshinensis]